MTPWVGGPAPRPAATEGDAPGPSGVMVTTFWVALLFLATRALGFVREPLVAAFYGASAATDAFYVALGIVNLIYAIALGGLVPSVIPVFAKKRRRDGDARAWSFLGGFGAWSSLVFVAAALAMLAAEDLVVSLFAPGLSVEAHATAVELFRWLMLLPLVTSLATIMSQALNCHHQFVLPAAGPLAGNAISLVLFLALVPYLGIHAAALAVMVGLVTQTIVVAPSVLARARRFGARPALRDPDLGTALRLGLPGVGAEALLSVWPFIIVFFGSALPAGTYASIQFGGKVQVLFLDVLVAAVGVVMFPRMVQAAQRGTGELRDLGRFTVRLMIMILLPVTVLLVALRYPLIQLIYERRVFLPEATARTATALGIFALSLVPLGIKDAVMRTFYAVHDVRTPFRAIIPAVLLDVVLSAALVGPFGLPGLLAAFSASAAFLAAALLWLAARRGTPIVDARFGRIVAGLAVATVVMLAALWLVSPALPGLQGRSGSVPMLVRLRDLTVAAGLCAVVYGGALLGLRDSVATRALGSTVERVRGWYGRRP